MTLALVTTKRSTRGSRRDNECAVYGRAQRERGVSLAAVQYEATAQGEAAQQGEGKAASPAPEALLGAERGAACTRVPTRTTALPMASVETVRLRSLSFSASSRVGPLRR